MKRSASLLKGCGVGDRVPAAACIWRNTPSGKALFWGCPGPGWPERRGDFG